jgi:hypothetical protein
VLGIPVIVSRHVPAGVIVLLDPSGIAYGEGEPEARVVRHGDILMDDEPEMSVGGVGSPSAPVAAQMVSLWATNRWHPRR